MQTHTLRRTTEPRPTVQSRRRELTESLRTATSEVARCERHIDSLIVRLAEKQLGGCGLLPITENTLRNAVSMRDFAQVNVARVREQLLDAPDDADLLVDGELPTEMRRAFDRIIEGGGSGNDEHRLTALDLGVGRYA